MFTPYLEIPRLDRYDFDVVEIHAHGAVDQTASPTWQFPDDEIDKLADPKVRALFVVNPSNPPSVMLAPATLRAHRRDHRDARTRTSSSSPTTSTAPSSKASAR